MSFSDYFENKLLNMLFKGVGFLLPDLYLGLADSVIDSSTGDNCGEVNGMGYRREPVGPGTWIVSFKGKITNAIEIVFLPVLEDWGTVTHFALFDSLHRGAGNLLIYGLLEAAWSVSPGGDEPKFEIGDIEITLD